MKYAEDKLCVVFYQFKLKDLQYVFSTSTKKILYQVFKYIYMYVY